MSQLLPVQQSEDSCCSLLLLYNLCLNYYQCSSRRTVAAACSFCTIYVSIITSAAVGGQLLQPAPSVQSMSQLLPVQQSEDSCCSLLLLYNLCLNYYQCS